MKSKTRTCTQQKTKRRRRTEYRNKALPPLQEKPSHEGLKSRKGGEKGGRERERAAHTTPKQCAPSVTQGNKEHKAKEKKKKKEEKCTIVLIRLDVKLPNVLHGVKLILVTTM